MSTLIQKLESAQLRKVPPFDPGDRVRVHFQVVEGSRRRTQVFEGFVIKRQGSGARETFTVRKQSFGVGVERTFPVHSPKIEKIEVAARGEVRRAKLYYLRDRIGKAARVRERAWAPQDAQGSIEDAELVAPTEEEPLEAAEGEEAAEAAEVAETTEAAETTEVSETAEAVADEATTDVETGEAAPAAEAPSDEPADEPADEPVDEPVDEPAEEPVAAAEPEPEAEPEADDKQDDEVAAAEPDATADDASTEENS